MKIAIVCSSGGHLVQALRCLKAFAPHEVILITYDTLTLVGFRHERIKRIYYVKYLGDTRLKVALMLLLALATLFKIFLKERPRFLFSTGSEIAVPAFVLAKLFFRTKLIFLESLTRVKAPSLTGRIVYHIADCFLVQSQPLLRHFGRKAMFKGNLL